MGVPAPAGAGGRGATPAAGGRLEDGAGAAGRALVPLLSPGRTVFGAVRLSGTAQLAGPCVGPAPASISSASGPGPGAAAAFAGSGVFPFDGGTGRLGLPVGVPVGLGSGCAALPLPPFPPAASAGVAFGRVDWVPAGFSDAPPPWAAGASGGRGPMLACGMTARGPSVPTATGGSGSIPGGSMAAGIATFLT